MNKMIASCAAVAFAVAGQASADVFTDSASFMSALEPGAYTNDFSDTFAGPSGDLMYSGGGFSYTVGTANALGPAISGLFNDPGLVSTDNAGDGILVTFTSGNVTAVGGNFWSTDINFQAAPATVTITLDDGTTEIFSSSSSIDFRGFTSVSTISSIFIDTDDAAAPTWSAMDNLTVGTNIPAPGTAALLGLGGLVATRRRR